MDANLQERYAIDLLADEAGGYFAVPSKDELRFMELLFDICKQFGIRYYTATSKERQFVDEVARITWIRQIEKQTGQKIETRSAFSA